MPSLQRGPFSSWVKWRMVQSGFFFSQTGLMQRFFRSLPPALLLENHNKPLPLRIQTYGKMSTFMRLITFVPWLSSFLTDAVSRHLKPHLKCRSRSVRRGMSSCLVLSLHELPFWPFSTHCWLCFFFFKWKPPCVKRMSLLTIWDNSEAFQSCNFSSNDMFSWRTVFYMRGRVNLHFALFHTIIYCTVCPFLFPRIASRSFDYTFRYFPRLQGSREVKSLGYSKMGYCPQQWQVQD